jgi:hypothetical protein
MKKVLLFVFFVFFLLLPALAWCSPFLVCDPNPGATKYILEMDGVELPEGVCLEDGSFLHDMAIYANTGEHTVRAKAGNLWGWSDWSVPFDFNTEIPGIPSGIGLSE